MGSLADRDPRCKLAAVVSGDVRVERCTAAQGRGRGVDPNPLVSWILDFADGESVTVFAELDHAARLVGDETIDLSYTGSVTVVEMGTGSDRLDMDLTFASISNAVITIDLGLDIAEGGALLGAVRHGDAEIGSIVGVFGAGPPEFSWPDCGG
jgi:hypothetical protein